jgi:AraC family transcriptional regulator
MTAVIKSQAESIEAHHGQKPLSTIPYHSDRANSFRLSLISDSPGMIEYPGIRNTIVSLHVGVPMQISCRRGGYSHKGMAIHGDIDIIPADTPSLWEIKERDAALILSISPQLLNMVAEEFDFEPSRIEIRNRFQIRDTQLENIGLALKAEMESGYPCGRLYFDSLAVAVTTRLIRSHSSMSLEPRKQNGRLPERTLRRVLIYIEDNLSQDISLGSIAAVAGLSVSHFKNLFRESIGLPVHQYLIRRRVEMAKRLLGEGKLSISQVALECGFAHQSHLAHHLRRVLGVSPKTLRAMLR